MSYKHSNAAREVSSERFDGATQRFIFIELSHATDHKGVLYQSQAELASQLLLSKVTISNEFKKLQEKGLIGKTAQGRYAVRLFITQEQAQAPESTGDIPGKPADIFDSFEGYVEVDEYGIRCIPCEVEEMENPSEGMQELVTRLKKAVAEGKLVQRPELVNVPQLNDECVVFDKPKA